MKEWEIRNVSRREETGNIGNDVINHGGVPSSEIPPPSDFLGNLRFPTHPPPFSFLSVREKSKERRNSDKVAQVAQDYCKRSDGEMAHSIEL